MEADSGWMVAVGPLLGVVFVPLAEDFGVSLTTSISAVQGGTIKIPVCIYL